MRIIHLSRNNSDIQSSNFVQLGESSRSLHPEVVNKQGILHTIWRWVSKETRIYMEIDIKINSYFFDKYKSYQRQFILLHLLSKYTCHFFDNST